jgi:hypothetical protein
MVASVALVTSMAVFASLGNVRHQYYYNYAPAPVPPTAITRDVSTPADDCTCATDPTLQTGSSTLATPQSDVTISTSANDLSEQSSDIDIGPPQAAQTPIPAIEPPGPDTRAEANSDGLRIETRTDNSNLEVTIDEGGGGSGGTSN